LQRRKIRSEISILNIQCHVFITAYGQKVTVEFLLFSSSQTAVEVNANVNLTEGGGGGVRLENATKVKGRSFVDNHFNDEISFAPHSIREVIIDDKIDGELVNIKIMSVSVDTKKEEEKFNMAVHQRYITSEKNGTFVSEKLAKFRHWKTYELGIDLNPHKKIKKNQNACPDCNY